jgi:hypothetical protein
MLDEIDADIAAGEVQLVRQHELIADLEKRGQNPAFAKSIVKELKAIQAKQIALRDKLMAEVARRALPGHETPTKRNGGARPDSP